MELHNSKLYCKLAGCHQLIVYYSCWISVEDPKSGAIWAFALPMLVVIIVSDQLKMTYVFSYSSQGNCTNALQVNS